MTSGKTENLQSPPAYVENHDAYQDIMPEPVLIHIIDD